MVTDRELHRDQLLLMCSSTVKFAINDCQQSEKTTFYISVAVGMGRDATQLNWNYSWNYSFDCFNLAAWCHIWKSESSVMPKETGHRLTVTVLPNIAIATCLTSTMCSILFDCTAHVLWQGCGIEWHLTKNRKVSCSSLATIPQQYCRHICKWKQ
jgi:hypothetical protein